MTLSLGIVGLASFYGPAYASRAADHSQCDVTAVAPLETPDENLRELSRPTRSAFVSEYDCEVVDSVDELLESGVDAVVVASPTTRRARDAITALQSETPVLLAKPAADQHSKAHELADVSAARDVPAMMTTPARFDDAVAELGHRTRDGQVGDVLAVRAAIRHDRVPSVGIGSNAEHAPGEVGATYAMSVYTADALLWLAGAVPARTYAEYGNVNTPYSSHPDIGHASVRFEDGAVGSMTVTYASDCRDPLGNWEVEVVGTDGTLRTAQQGYEGIHWYGDETGNRRTEAFGRTPSPILDRQFEAFVDCVQSGVRGRAPQPSAVAEALTLCEAWDQSAAKQEPISFTDWPPSAVERFH